MLAALLTLLSIAPCALAQEWTKEELNRPRLYIGLSRGALLLDQETHLKSFIALQKLVRKVEDYLKETVSTIKIGDYLWTASDEWEALARRGYTHYVVAVPREITLEWVDVSWLAGQISSTGVRILKAELHESTRITIPGPGERATIVEPGSADAVKRDTARRLADSLRVLFPEIRSQHKFAIRCISSIPEETNSRFAVMAYLSRNLEEPPWASAGWFSVDSARKWCQDKHDKRADADLTIGGWLAQKTSKNLTQAIIEIDDLLPERRKDHAKIYEQDDGRRYASNLEEFCVEQHVFQPSVMSSLVRYIQAHGLKIERIKYEAEFKCQ